MAGDIKQPELIIPYAKMLSSLASGNQCAAKAFDFLGGKHLIHTSVSLFLFPPENQLSLQHLFHA